MDLEERLQIAEGPDDVGVEVTIGIGLENDVIRQVRRGLLQCAGIQEHKRGDQGNQSQEYDGGQGDLLRQALGHRGMSSLPI